MSVNNLKDLPPDKRKEIANSPAILDFMVAASDAGEDGLIDDLRARGSIDDAQEFAKTENPGLGAVQGKTIDDVYVATGTHRKTNKCMPPERWDPITQTCVLM